MESVEIVFKKKKNTSLVLDSFLEIQREAQTTAVIKSEKVSFFTVNLMSEL